MAEREKKGDEEKVIETTDSFVERFAASVVVTVGKENIVVIDFLKPVLSLVGKDGRIVGYKGELRPDVRIFLPYSVAKKLRDALSEQIKRVEGEAREVEG